MLGSGQEGYPIGLGDTALTPAYGIDEDRGLDRVRDAARCQSPRCKIAVQGSHVIWLDCCLLVSWFVVFSFIDLVKKVRPRKYSYFVEGSPRRLRSLLCTLDSFV